LRISQEKKKNLRKVKIQFQFRLKIYLQRKIVIREIKEKLSTEKIIALPQKEVKITADFIIL